MYFCLWHGQSVTPPSTEAMSVWRNAHYPVPVMYISWSVTHSQFLGLLGPRPTDLKSADDKI